MGSVTTGVEANCPGTATETAKILAYLLDYDDEGCRSVTRSTSPPSPRPSIPEPSRGAPRVRRGTVSTPYGEHITEGLSHIGMMKKWYRELEDVGLRPEYLRQLKNDGVEQSIRMWAHPRRSPARDVQIPRQVLGNDLIDGRTCEEDPNCCPGEFCAAGVPGVVPKRCRAARCRRALYRPRLVPVGQVPGWPVRAGGRMRARRRLRMRGEFCGDLIAGWRSCKASVAYTAIFAPKPRNAPRGAAPGVSAPMPTSAGSSDCGSGQYRATLIAGKRVCRTLLGAWGSLHRRRAMRHRALRLGLLRRCR